MSPDEMFPYVVGATIIVAVLSIVLHVRKRRHENQQEDEGSQQNRETDDSDTD
jgi:hypothetical protein